MTANTPTPVKEETKKEEPKKKEEIPIASNNEAARLLSKEALKKALKEAKKEAAK
jgi:hypothetical protein